MAQTKRRRTTARPLCPAAWAAAEAGPALAAPDAETVAPSAPPQEAPERPAALPAADAGPVPAVPGAKTAAPAAPPQKAPNQPAALPAGEAGPILAAPGAETVAPSAPPQESAEQPAALPGAEAGPTLAAPGAETVAPAAPPQESAEQLPAAGRNLRAVLRQLLASPAVPGMLLAGDEMDQMAVQVAADCGPALTLYDALAIAQLAKAVCKRDTSAAAFVRDSVGDKPDTPAQRRAAVQPARNAAAGCGQARPDPTAAPDSAERQLWRLLAARLDAAEAADPEWPDDLPKAETAAPAEPETPEDRAAAWADLPPAAAPDGPDLYDGPSVRAMDAGPEDLPAAPDDPPAAESLSEIWMPDL